MDAGLTNIDEVAALFLKPAEFIYVMERQYKSWTDVFHNTPNEPAYGVFWPVRFQPKYRSDWQALISEDWKIIV